MQSVVVQVTAFAHTNLIVWVQSPDPVVGKDPVLLLSFQWCCCCCFVELTKECGAKKKQCSARGHRWIVSSQAVA